MKKLCFLVFLALATASLTGQNVEIQGDATITGQVTVMDTILFADGTELASACLQVLQDEDSDTKVEVEKLVDEDIIRFTIQGVEIARFENNRLELADGGGSVFIGYKAGENDAANNSKSVYIGYETGQMSNGFGNTAIGANAMTNNSIGAENTMLGASAGYQSSGSQNVFIGRDAGRLSSTSSSNTYLGHRAGREATGSGNIFIGKSAGENQAGSHKLVIDNSTTATPLIYGEFNNNLLRINGKLNINGEYAFPEVDGAIGQVLRYTGNGLVEWANPSSTSVLSDADNDTKIQMERFRDEDQIRFTVGGYEGMYMDTVAGSGRLNIDAWTFMQKTLALNESDINFTSSTIGEQNGIRWGNPVLGFRMLNSSAAIGDNKLNLQYKMFAIEKDLMTWDNSGNVGVGTQEPLRKFHVSTDSPTNHVMRIENTSSNAAADGLEIKINRVVTGHGNNYITFTDANSVAGRIEGFSIGEGPNFTDFPGIDFDAYFDVDTIIDAVFEPGSWPVLNPGSWPLLNKGSLPSLSGGSFGSLSLDVDFDDLQDNLECQANPFCNNLSSIINMLIISD